VSFKSLDIQVSLPRAAEMAPLQHQQQQRATNEQSLLGQQALRTAEQAAARAQKAESASKAGISDRQAGGRERKSSSGSGKRQQETAQDGAHVSEHPYKGKHIDFSG